LRDFKPELTQRKIKKGVGHLQHSPTKVRNVDRQFLNADAEMGGTFFYQSFGFILIQKEQINMDNNKLKKLSLKKVTLVELDNNQMKNVKGGLEAVGFLSIGYECSSENSCRRISSNGPCNCCPSSRNWCE